MATQGFHLGPLVIRQSFQAEDGTDLDDTDRYSIDLVDENGLLVASLPWGSTEEGHKARLKDANALIFAVNAMVNTGIPVKEPKGVKTARRKMNGLPVRRRK